MFKNVKRLVIRFWLVTTAEPTASPRVDAPSGMNLNDWHRQYKERFELADVLETYCDDKVRVAGGERAGTVHVECPFEEFHSSTGGTATMAMNPEANKDDVWTVFCKHDACQGRHKLEFLGQMLADEWFDEKILLDDGFMIPAPDEDVPTEEEIAETRPAAVEAADFDHNSTDADIKKLFKRHMRLGIDRTEQAALMEVLVSNTRLGKRGLGQIWNELAKEKTQRERERAAADPETFEGFPLVNVWDFKDVTTWGEGRIEAHNADSPSLFHYMNSVARVMPNSKGQYGIRILTQSEFSAYLNKFTTWNHQTMIGDQIRTRGVSCPLDVVSYLYNDLDAAYPPLRGVTGTPYYDENAELVCDNGYHASSQMFLAMAEGFNVPDVSSTPTADDMQRATGLIESALGDFLFDGMTRADGQAPSYANAVGLLIQHFCRPMIPGTVPASLINKPSAGEGAGLLLDSMAITWTGDVAVAMEYPVRKEEIGKTLLAKLRSGTAYILFDNVSVNIDSSALAIAIAQGFMDGRLLGRTDGKAVDPVEITAPMIFTGINVTASLEMRRRLVLIQMESGEALPAERTGPKPGTTWRHAKLKQWVRQNRADLVWACLTLISRWIANGKKEFTPEIPKGGFPEWQGVIGGILHDAGIEGFCANETELKDATTDTRDDGLYTLASVIADYPAGLHFYTGSQSDGTGIMDLLNKGPDGNPISIPTWGFSEEDGTYGNAAKVGKHFKEFARKPHRARRRIKGGGDGAFDVEIKFEQGEDTHRKCKVYILHMRLPGGEWVKTTDDPGWEKIAGGT